LVSFITTDQVRRQLIGGERKQKGSNLKKGNMGTSIQPYDGVRAKGAGKGFGYTKAESGGFGTNLNSRSSEGPGKNSEKGRQGVGGSGRGNKGTERSEDILSGSMS